MFKANYIYINLGDENEMELWGYVNTPKYLTDTVKMDGLREQVGLLLLF